MRSVAGQHFGQGLDDRLRHVGLVFGLRANAVQILQRAQCRQRILAQLADRAVCVLLGHVQHLRILQHGERVGFNRIVRNVVELSQRDLQEREVSLRLELSEPGPQALLDKVLAARTFNSGFATVEFTSSALVDLAFHSLEEAVALFPADEEVFVIGGAQIYAAALPLARKFYLTRVFRAYEGDTRFPAWDEREWRLVSSESFSGGKDYPWPFAFELYERR